jgi:hypothetical protein
VSMEKVGVLARAVNFGTVRENVGMPVCAVDYGVTWNIIMFGCMH